MKREEVLQKAEALINGERRDDYGDVRGSFKAIAEGWSLILGHHVSPRQVALCMVWLKVCRELHQHKDDSLVDMAGYTALAAELGEE